MLPQVLVENIEVKHVINTQVLILLFRSAEVSLYPNIISFIFL